MYSQVVNIGSSRGTISLSVEAGNTAEQTFTLSNSGNATLEWNLENIRIGEEVTFTKTDFADWTLEENQDRITEQVWITRANEQGIFNFAYESSFRSDESPAGTEWSYGNSLNLSSDDYRNWLSAISENPPEMVGRIISMHAIEEDRYFDIEFTSWTEWTEESSGGGFSYIRNEVFTQAGLSSNSGEIAAGASGDITLTVDALNLAAGTYSFNIVIASNATSTPELIIPVELTVTGSAELDVAGSLSFDNTFIGANTTEVLTIVNDGTASLTISEISSDNEAFASSLSDLTVPAFSSRDIEVIFTPALAQTYTGTLTITSNDASSPTEVSLSGNGFDPPVIEVSETSFAETLDYGNTTTATLTINNTGASSLNWGAKLVIPNSTVSFEKKNYAETSEPANQDRITDNVWITRDVSQGIFNIKQENSYIGSSPLGTEWVDESTQIALSDDLTYSGWRSAHGGCPSCMIGETYSMRTTDDNRYFDIELSQWTEGGNGGGFAYTRTEVPGWITLSDYSNTVEASSSTEITLEFNANRFGGTHVAQLIIYSDDPLQPEIVIPVTITINGTPEIQVPVTTYDFNSVYVGATSIATQVEVVNNGTADLTITDVVSDNTAFTVSATSAVIAGGGGSSFFEVYFTPGTAGDASATLTLTSDDPVNSSVTLDLSGKGVVPPSISVTHNELTVDLDAGVYDETISIANTEGADLKWTFSASIDETLVSLNENFNLILNQLPGYYEFRYDGGSGNIGDGGNDIYDGGNELSTDLSGGTIDYSDNVVADGTGLFGIGTTYYTRHFNGLFVLAADLNGVSEFTIDGNIGADGNGVVTGPILEIEHHGVTYQGFVKIVSEGGDPSIHHLIILEKNADVTQEYDETSEDDYHKLSGLSASNRLYYLLFTREDGTAYSEEQLKAVMNTFLDITAGVPGYISLSATSGNTASGNADDITMRIDPTAVPKGISGTELKVISNDINTPEVIIPITFISTPKAIVSEAELSFGDVFQEYPETQEFIVTNEGLSNLEVTSIVSDNDQFTLESSSLSLANGEEAVVKVIYSPSIDGTATGTITLTTNDPAHETIEVLVDGNGLTAPGAVVSPESITVKLFPGESTTETISIENTQGINLDWTISEGSMAGSLESVLSNLNSGFSNITGVIPSRYDFTYDITGDAAIETGGNDMFSSGNYIINSASPSTPLLYSDNVIIEAQAAFNNSKGYFGEGSMVFTRHLTGLFVMVADVNQLDEFGITGDLGSSVSVDGTVLELTYQGKVYEGFVKRVYGGITPSVNHIVIAEKTGNATQDIDGFFMGDDDHLVSGLNGTDRIYYLMYGGTEGAYIDDTATETIMQTFLETILPESNLSATSGSTAAGDTDVIDYTFSADDYPTGITRFNVVVNSNDPEKPSISIPVTVSVGNVRVENIIDDIIINEGFGTEVIDISTTFRDADDDVLTYIPASSREDLLLASVAGESLTLTEKGIGTSRISVAATDGTNTAFADFNVRINAVPVAVNPIEDQVYERSFGTAQFDLTTAFEDADTEDELSYAVSLSVAGVVEASIDNGILTLTEVAAGTVNITVSVTDGVGGELDYTFEVSVNKTEATITITDLSFEFDGTAKEATIITNPAGLNVVVTYNGSEEAPVEVGEYDVLASIEDVNFKGSASATLIIRAVTAIDKEQIADIVIYPNPASSHLNVVLGIEKTDVDIIDISGSVIKHIAGYTSGESIDVSTLNSGVYIVRVQTEDAIANLRFIKK
ncbi:hypothetical protein GCM10011506_05330 [Marivirga lumbricoides]|uniref:Secretion system C-terminal sorting domain-containing protein n=2 Tax=Marivirga lumbricoides TaxID=1046115 RepID=A0ABQ1LG32_9BACT|nr:hypothetical protein GCM10011506_05330 [Marivirga lumbricoides]